jgi:FkbM family methyltransferase
MMGASCGLAPEGKSPTATARHAAVHALIPLARAGVRYPVRRTWSVALWWYVVEPYFAWHAHDFVARPTFAARMGGNSREILQQHVYYFGEWEPDLTAWVRETLRNGDGFIDVGANVGYFTLLAASTVGPAGRVVAVEPAPGLYRQLVTNVRRNRFGNVRCVEAAASDADTEIELFAGTESHEGLATMVEELGAGTVRVRVRGARTSSIITPDEMRQARLIKIDVEGAEGAVLAGMEELWEFAREDLELIVEVHPRHLEKSGQSVDELVEMLRSRGFNAYRLEVDYSPESYLSGRPRWRPERVEARVAGEAHLVFSRRDRARL